MLNTEISILLNTEKNPILEFNNTEIFNISTENTELSDDLNYEDHFLQKLENWFFSNFFQDFQYSLVFLVFFGRFRDSILKKFHIEKKIPKEKIQVFSIFTGFWCFFGTFSISGLLKIWVIPFNSIEYWSSIIPKKKFNISPHPILHVSKSQYFFSNCLNLLDMRNLQKHVKVRVF